MNKIVLPLSHPFAGIGAKLNRSHENICNLESEIARFFQDSKYPVLSEDNQKIIPEAVEYLYKLIIPPRFSVLSGEIIHHLRSCLDHLVWHFSDAAYREEKGNIRFIEFPILKEPPTPTNVFARYERKIKGITSTGVLDLIKRLQPYNRPAPSESLLLAIHDLDIIDKHRALVIVLSSGALKFPIDLWQRYVSHECGVPGSSPVDLMGEFKNRGEILPQIAFSDFCGGESEIVVQALTGMHNYVIKIVEGFDKFLT
jgi:hypothetical protein